MDSPDTSQANLPVGRNLKIGLFHLGSGMADVISTGIWNRIMISDLGYAATPVGLLASLRYFLAPVSVWAGRMSDKLVIGGYRRLFWIWLGRAMMVLSTFLLGYATAEMLRVGGANAESGADALPWLVTVVALLLFSLGTGISGSTFLALVYDRAGEDQRGRAVGIVWTFLLVGYAVGGFGFGVMLPSHEAGAPLALTPDLVLNVFALAGVILGALWFFSVVGEERRVRTGQASADAPADAESAASAAPQEYSTSLFADLKLVWQHRAMRAFFWYLSLSMLFAFSQDLILEPFGGQVFGMDPRHTTRFTAYWATTAIIGTIVFLFLSRRYKWMTHTRMSFLGMAVLVGTFALFALSAFAQLRALVTPGLVLLGIGLGVWNVGTLGLMMDMSPRGHAGTFLGFWTLVVTLARGIGVAGGGVGRDVGLVLTGDLALAYGAVFSFAAVGLGVALWALARVNVRAYKAEQGQPPQTASAEQVLAGAMD